MTNQGQDAYALAGPSAPSRVVDARRTLTAALKAKARAEKERDQLRAEVQRLRLRIHEAVDECQRRYAPMQSDHDRLVALHREVIRRHGEDQVTKGENPICGISTYGVAITAVIAQERDQLRATVERVRALCDEYQSDGMGLMRLSEIRAALGETTGAGTGQEAATIRPGAEKTPDPVLSDHPASEPPQTGRPTPTKPGEVEP